MHFRKFPQRLFVFERSWCFSTIYYEAVARLRIDGAAFCDDDFPEGLVGRTKVKRRWPSLLRILVETLSQPIVVNFLQDLYILVYEVQPKHADLEIFREPANATSLLLPSCTARLLEIEN